MSAKDIYHDLVKTALIKLEDTESDRMLFLAVPKEVFFLFMRYTFFQKAIEKHNLKLIVFHPDKEEIKQWIN